MNLGKLGMRKRYILSFMLVSIIPTLIVLLLYLPVIDLFKSEAIKSDVIRNNTIRATMDERMSELQNLSVQMNNDKRIKEFLYKKAPLDNYGNYYIKDILELIQSYKAGNNFVSLIAVYLIQSSSVVTNEGKYTADYFFDNILKYEGMKQSDIKQMMMEPYYNKYLPLKKINGSNSLYGEYITYIHSIPIGENNQLANVIMLIDEKKILSMIGDTNEGLNQQVMIVTENGEDISSKGNDEKLKKLILDKIEHANDSITMDIPDQSSMVVSYSTSSINNWIYVVFSSMDSIISRISKIRDIAILSAILSIGTGILLSVCMAGSSYKPWLQLVDQIKKFSNKTSNDINHKNEYYFAMDAIDGMKMEREKFQRDMGKSSNHLKKYILQNLCMRKNPSIDDVNREECSLPYTSFCVIIVDIDVESQLRSKIAKFLTKLVNINLSNTVSYTFEEEKGKLCIVVNTNLYSTDLLVQQVKHLQDVMSIHFNILFYVGIGGIYQNVEKMYVSYKEAKNAIEYCFIKGSESVIFFTNIEKYIFTSLNLPVHSDNRLYNSVKTGDIKNCTRLLDEYFSSIINTGNVSFQYMSCLFYYFISMIIKACDEAQLDFEEIFHQSLEQVLDIDKYRNSRQIIDSVYHVYIVMCEYMQNNNKSHNSSLKEEINHYICDNYTSKSISLIEIADKFDYSSSYLSRFIKQEFGIGFGELLSNNRLECAKRLLSSGSRTISEISEMVGYSSVNSFTRAFKRQEEITPSQYRDISFPKDKENIYSL